MFAMESFRKLIEPNGEQQNGRLQTENNKDMRIVLTNSLKIIAVLLSKNQGNKRAFM
jgi:hypothetical protein